MEHHPQTIAAPLVEALAALAQAEAAVRAALALCKGEAPPPVLRAPRVGHRTTSTQVMTILAEAGEPMELIDIADRVLAMRRGEDEPRPRGGTRYQEVCRSALLRLIQRGAVVRVAPEGNRGRMRFALSKAKIAA